MRKELERLGFKFVVEWENPGWKTPGREAIYVKDCKELWIGWYPGLLVEYDGESKYYKDPEKEQEAVKWLEKIIENKG